MALLKDYSDLQNVINNIAFLTSNENTDFITNVYNYILYNYGNRTQSPLITGDLSAENVANIINSMYSTLWNKLKIMNDTDVSLTGYTDKEVTHNQIYGYNSETGVDDYETIKTYTKDYDDIYTNYTNALAFFGHNNYYTIICCCIAHELTLCVYVEED